ncbi:hypothetical protein HOK51_00770 [Candidatus Woesearchaeota archaeon]|jgi:hypothetical protein|nr:hypothetical protein [Candidatus Woesearchaeota archaeon]MBT6518347.1 hypothetical protein [Candidatus Woesearchaeota archaeon]MBT7366644.1 hypothetical protein [Candidatus Woesearchaeota archaeon]
MTPPTTAPNYTSAKYNPTTAKLDFFMFLRRDPLVKKLNAEENIREITQAIFEYQTYVNNIRFLTRHQYIQQKSDLLSNVENDKKYFEKNGEPNNEEHPKFARYQIYISMKHQLESLEEKIDLNQQPVNLDFRDIQFVAYEMGTANSKNVISSLFSLDPLTSTRRKIKKAHFKYAKTKQLDTACFDKDTQNMISNLQCATNFEEVNSTYNQLFQKTSNLIDRSRNLIQFSMYEMRVIRHDRKTLDWKDICTLCKYFDRMEDINSAKKNFLKTILVRTKQKYEAEFKAITKQPCKDE